MDSTRQISREMIDENFNQFNPIEMNSSNEKETKKITE